MSSSHQVPFLVTQEVNESTVQFTVNVGCHVFPPLFKVTLDLFCFFVDAILELFSWWSHLGQSHLGLSSFKQWSK